MVVLPLPPPSLVLLKGLVESPYVLPSSGMSAATSIGLLNICDARVLARSAAARAAACPSRLSR